MSAWRLGSWFTVCNIKKVQPLLGLRAVVGDGQSIWIGDEFLVVGAVLVCESEHRDSGDEKITHRREVGLDSAQNLPPDVLPLEKVALSHGYFVTLELHFGDPINLEEIFDEVPYFTIKRFQRVPVFANRNPRDLWPFQERR